MFLLHDMGTVIFAPDYCELDTWQILRPASLHQHNIVLLEIVSFTGDKHYRLLTIGEANPCTFTVGRVGLFGLPDHGLQDYSLHLWATKRGTKLFGRWGWFALAMHLIEGSHGPG